MAAPEEDFGWLSYEEVDVFGHDDVAADGEGVAIADLFEGALEEVFCVWGGEVGSALIAGEGYEVEMVGLLVTD
jgi:hypothetical protein